MKLSERVAFISSFNWGRSTSKLTHIIVGRIWFLQAVRPRASVLICLLTGDLSQFLAMKATPRAVHNVATGFSESEQVRDQEMEERDKPVRLGSCLILAVPFHHCLPYSVHQKQITRSSPHSRA